MSRGLVPLLAACLLGACERRAADPGGPPEGVERPASEVLLEEFPLLPMAEPRRWSRLREAEEVAPATDESRETIEVLTAELRRLHPFSSDADGFELGAIRYDTASATFRLPARVRYPDEGDERHPGELEVLACGEQGRVHETLFVADVRPLHLELLLHLAGYRKGEGRFMVRAVTSSGDVIAVRELVRRLDGREWPGPIEWEFSGSEFGDPYAPDLSGDLAIFWHAHDSVLRVADEEIGSGQLKLRAIRHPDLPNGSPVTVEMTLIGGAR